MTQLERFIQKGEIEIGRHPFSNLRRLLVLEGGLQWYPTAKQIILNFMCYFLDENGERYKLESIRSYPQQLIADNSTKIGTNMEIIPNPGIKPDINNEEILKEYDKKLSKWEKAKTEYEYFVETSNNPVNIFEVMLNITLLRASVEGGAKFDK